MEVKKRSQVFRLPELYFGLRFKKTDITRCVGLSQRMITNCKIITWVSNISKSIVKLIY